MGNRGSFMNNSWGGGNDRGLSGIHCVHMRGLPFKATQADIADVSKIFYFIIY